MKMLRILSYFTRLRAPPFSPSTSMSPNHLSGLPGEPHLESPPIMMMTVMMVMVIMMLMMVMTVMVMMVIMTLIKIMTMVMKLLIIR